MPQHLASIVIDVALWIVVAFVLVVVPIIEVRRALRDRRAARDVAIMRRRRDLYGGDGCARSRLSTESAPSSSSGGSTKST